ncbi:MAG: hypothetical protein ACREX3_01370 [Gammaproteobacteria bacterium]
MDRWIDEQRFGTRRDFALYARGGTKSLSEAEWDWLDAQLDLAGLGVQRHTPALWLRAPFTLCRGEQCLDLRAVPDCIALTPPRYNTAPKPPASTSYDPPSIPGQDRDEACAKYLMRRMLHFASGLAAA